MKKNVYSVVLMEDVVNAVDQLAYQNNTSRSNMINSILAEYCSFQTPQQKISDIFEEIEQLMDDAHFKIANPPTESNLLIKSALSYKYNPSMRYSLTIYERPKNKLGLLKAGFRTSSATLLSCIHEFFNIWADFDEKYLPSRIEGELNYEIENGKYRRELALPEYLGEHPEETLADAISTYVKNLDALMKLYFKNIDQADLHKMLERTYLTNLRKSEIIL